MNKEEKPWLIVDEPDGEIIVGNRAGLESLRNKIDRVLNGENEDSLIGIEDTNICSVTLETKESYHGGIREYKETFVQKILGFVLACWFLVLPFVALILIIYLLFFVESTKKPVPCFPMQNCIKNELQQKP